jgi:16S rRNA (guanine966-N2)-methyltransferase
VTTLRVTAGRLKGRRIPVPKGEVRPTSERARQGYFNIVADRIEGAHFLDLFAGSGIFSFEALSRGAASATAVDQSRANTEAMSRVAQSLQVAIEVINSDVISAHGRLKGRRFDLVYADPPYNYDRYDDLLLALDRGPLAEDAIVAIEHSRRSEPFSAKTLRLSLWRRAEYGEVWITFFSSVPQPLQ